MNFNKKLCNNVSAQLYEFSFPPLCSHQTLWIKQLRSRINTEMTSKSCIQPNPTTCTAHIRPYMLFTHIFVSETQLLCISWIEFGLKRIFLHLIRPYRALNYGMIGNCKLRLEKLNLDVERCEVIGALRINQLDINKSKLENRWLNFFLEISESKRVNSNVSFAGKVKKIYF